ncbi:hypothetical protein [Vibrio hepatarius]|uniref:hypothetical protein n=1 Tax=Vibrio hepatarius TaxID=171383 RepID=UPI0020A383D3|nr:hypothetical protein [Vibrio hepatarius]
MGIPVNIPIVGETVPSVANPVDGMNWGSIWGEAKDMFAFGANTWLQYQQGKRTGDFTGANQDEVYGTPTTAQPDPNPPMVQPTASVGGIPVTYLAIGGLLVVGAVLVAKS